MVSRRPRSSWNPGRRWSFSLLCTHLPNPPPPSFPSRGRGRCSFRYPPRVRTCLLYPFNARRPILSRELATFNRFLCRQTIICLAISQCPADPGKNRARFFTCMRIKFLKSTFAIQYESVSALTLNILLWALKEKKRVYVCMLTSCFYDRPSVNFYAWLLHWRRAFISRTFVITCHWSKNEIRIKLLELV